MRDDFNGNHTILEGKINEFVDTSLNRALISNKNEGNRIPNYKTSVGIDVKQWKNNSRKYRGIKDGIIYMHVSRICFKNVLRS